MIPAGKPEHESEDDGAERQLDGRREQRRELAQHRLLRDHRLAEIALEDAGQIDPVLDEDRLVEAVFLAQLLVAGGIDAALAGKRFDRIARYEADEEEGQQRDPDEGRDDQADAGEDESEHRLNVKRRSGSMKPLRRRLKG